MARKRMIDPDFWTDRRVAQLNPSERLFFLGCISAADDEGRLIGDPAYLRSRIFPYDEISLDEIRRMRDRVAETVPGFMAYAVDGEEYVAFTHWDRYQWPSHRKESKLPQAPLEMITTPSQQEVEASTTSVQPRLGKVSIDKTSSSMGKKKNHDDKESQKQTEREKTNAAYVRLYVASPPGVDVPYHLYPSEAIQDKIEEMADIWGDDVVQDAIKEAVDSGKPQLPPRYIESIIFRWKNEGRVKPRISKEEYERIEAQKR